MTGVHNIWGLFHCWNIEFYKIKFRFQDCLTFHFGWIWFHSNFSGFMGPKPRPTPNQPHAKSVIAKIDKVIEAKPKPRPIRPPPPRSLRIVPGTSQSKIDTRNSTHLPPWKKLKSYFWYFCLRTTLFSKHQKSQLNSKCKPLYPVVGLRFTFPPRHDGYFLLTNSVFSVIMPVGHTSCLSSPYHHRITNVRTSSYVERDTPAAVLVVLCRLSRLPPLTHFSILSIEKWTINKNNLQKKSTLLEESAVLRARNK